ncbi:hybrid sensor histidine kinase/response regulator [Chitinasiproducens palmae]|nr:hybrid sensor histidine kinase/response regulator [Chitinasiproducens palmae]
MDNNNMVGLESGLIQRSADTTAAVPQTKLLIVDDVEQNIVALEALLQRPDVEILRASSGSEALELLLGNDVALSLIDVQMPDMDGFELAELMRGSPRTRHVPIIFLTATDRNAMRTFRGYEAGAVDFLYKPFDPHILRSKVDVFVQLQAQKLQLAQQLDAWQQIVRTNEIFTAVLGHDLRNPLAAVLASAELLSHLAGDDKRLLTAAQRIHASGTRMARMIDQVLDVARVRSGQLTLAPTPTDAQLLCRGIITEFEAVGGQAALRLTASGDTMLVADGDRLAQVLSNLVGNAIRHGDRNEPITVEIDGTHRHAVQIAVSNGGMVDPAIRDTLFRPFSGLSQNEVARGSDRGLGLGLYIAQELVNAHGGRIELYSSITEGTTFMITLPRRPPPA